MSEEAYIDMIYDSLSGTLSNEEQLILNGWINASEENQTTFNEIKRLRRLEESFRDDTDYDTNAALHKIKASRKQAKVKKFRINKWWSVAAAATLLFGCWYIIKSGSDSLPFAASDTIEHYELDDGSQVWLQPDSRFSFDIDDEGVRKVTLVGSAYFDVKSDPHKPFSVMTNNFSILVLGTQFSVNSANILQPQLIVTEGNVRIATNSDTADIGSHQIAAINENNKIITQTIFNRSNLESWKTNRLVYNDQKLDLVIEDLERHYNVAIRIKPPQPQNCSVTAIFVDESLEGILQHIKNTTQLTTKKTTNGWEISGSSCN